MLSDGKVACYPCRCRRPRRRVPPTPTAAPAPAGSGGRRRGHACGAAADEASTAVLTTSPPPRLASRSRCTLLAPAPRAVGEALVGSVRPFPLGRGRARAPAGVLPSASALSRGDVIAAVGGGTSEEGADAPTVEPIEWLLPGVLTHRPSPRLRHARHGTQRGLRRPLGHECAIGAYVMQRHGAAVTEIALMGAYFLASYAADHTLHGYDVSADPETGQASSSSAVASTSPSTCAGCASQPSRRPRRLHTVRVIDIHGDLLAKLSPSTLGPSLSMLPGCGTPADRDARKLTSPRPARAPSSPRQAPRVPLPIDAEPAAGGGSATEAEGAEGGRGRRGRRGRRERRLQRATAAAAPRVVFARGYCPLDVPAHRAATRSEPTVQILRALLREYKHEQRLDANLMASVPRSPRRRASRAARWAARRQVGSTQRGGSRAGSTRASSQRRCEEARRASVAGWARCPRTTCSSRGAPSRPRPAPPEAAADPASSRKASRAGEGLSEQAQPGSSRHLAEARARRPPLNGRWAMRRSHITEHRRRLVHGGGTADDLDRRSIGQSVAPSVGQSSAGTAL